MKLIVTRPEDDAGPLAAKLQTLGHEAIMVPLLEIVCRNSIELPDLPFQALCMTSANGLTAEFDVSRFHATPFFAIGPQSATAARRHGFTRVSDKGGNVEGLMLAMARQLDPKNGPILYISGSETTGDLEGKLRHHGFSVTRVMTYDAVPRAVSELPDALAEADGVLLYSPRSARLWTKQVGDTTQEDAAGRLTHFCLSANVAAALPQSWPKRISHKPDENGMLALLDHGGEAE